MSPVSPFGMSQTSLSVQALRVTADDGDYDEPHRAQPVARDEAGNALLPAFMADYTGSRGLIRALSLRTSGSARRWRCAGRCRPSCRRSYVAGRRRRELRKRSICLGLAKGDRRALADAKMITKLWIGVAGNSL